MQKRTGTEAGLIEIFAKYQKAIADLQSSFINEIQHKLERTRELAIGGVLSDCEHLASLPDDMWAVIFGMIDRKTLLVIRLVSKQWNTRVSEDSLWKDNFVRDWPSLVHVQGDYLKELVKRRIWLKGAPRRFSRRSATDEVLKGIVVFYSTFEDDKEQTYYNRAPVYSFRAWDDHVSGKGILLKTFVPDLLQLGIGPALLHFFSDPRDSAESESCAWDLLVTITEGNENFPTESGILPFFSNVHTVSTEYQEIITKSVKQSSQFDTRADDPVLAMMRLASTNALKGDTPRLGAWAQQLMIFICKTLTEHYSYSHRRHKEFIREFFEEKWDSIFHSTAGRSISSFRLDFIRVMIVFTSKNASSEQAKIATQFVLRMYQTEGMNAAVKEIAPVIIQTFPLAERIPALKRYYRDFPRVNHWMADNIFKSVTKRMIDLNTWIQCGGIELLIQLKKTKPLERVAKLINQHPNEVNESRDVLRSYADGRAGEAMKRNFYARNKLGP